MTTPDEIEVARRNLLAELKAIGGRSRNYQGLYEIDDRTLADVIEVLEALKPPPASQEFLNRLQAAEDLCVMFAWSPSTAGPNESDRAKAAHELWLRWSTISGNDCSTDANPHLTDELIATLAAKRDATRAATLQHFFGPEGGS